jgi:hypothetical protein
MDMCDGLYFVVPWNSEKASGVRSTKGWETLDSSGSDKPVFTSEEKNLTYHHKIPLPPFYKFENLSLYHSIKNITHLPDN